MSTPFSPRSPPLAWRSDARRLPRRPRSRPPTGTPASGVISPERRQVSFTLHKWQRRIGVEQSTVVPLQAIQAATLVPAKAMRLECELGTVTPGKRADLILVDGDPLADIHALRRVVSVVSGGRMHDTASLWRSVGFEP